MLKAIATVIWSVHADERGEVSWKWLGLGILIGAVAVVVLAISGIIKFLIPGE